jgi:two-component system, OmpR family, heavy metal sensor histidine kinase CusS
MMQRKSIRFRLTVWYAAVLTAGLGLFGGLLWLSLRHQLLADLDQDLEGRATRLEAYYRSEVAEKDMTPRHLSIELSEFCQALPETSYVSLQGANGFTFHFPADAKAAPVASRMLQRQLLINGETLFFELGTPTEDVIYVLKLLRFLLLSLVPVVAAIACFGGYWLSGRALKPVQDVTAAALMITIENLSGRLPVPHTGDEVAQLVRVLNSMLERLESAVKTLSQFAADASHELRTPVAVIRTTAELALRRARPPESYRESLQGIVVEAERMTQLVEDLLTLARSDKAVAGMPLMAVDLCETLQAVRAEMASLAEARHIDVILTPGEAPALVDGNRAALHRLFVLLLDNALKYSYSGGVVQMTIARLNGRVAVTIRDFGTGIREEDLPHIFERFYRADRARSGGGHGLGLPLAESIARAHHATIEVKSVEGKGSSFQVIFKSRQRAGDSPVVLADARPERAAPVMIPDAGPGESRLP